MDTVHQAIEVGRLWKDQSPAARAELISALRCLADMLRAHGAFNEAADAAAEVDRLENDTPSPTPRQCSAQPKKGHRPKRSKKRK